MRSEQERVAQMLDSLAQGNAVTEKLVIDRDGRGIRAEKAGHHSKGGVVAAHEDFDVY